MYIGKSCDVFCVAVNKCMMYNVYFTIIQVVMMSVLILGRNNPINSPKK